MLIRKAVFNNEKLFIVLISQSNMGVTLEYPASSKQPPFNDADMCQFPCNKHISLIHIISFLFIDVNFKFYFYLDMREFGYKSISSFHILMMLFIANTTCSWIQVILDTSQFLLCQVLMTSQAPPVAGYESFWIQVNIVYVMT